MIKGLTKVRRNPHGPARFTGNYLPWICETPDGITYCDTRESARGIAREYQAERKKLNREFIQAQGKADFYECNN